MAYRWAHRSAECASIRAATDKCFLYWLICRLLSWLSKLQISLNLKLTSSNGFFCPKNTRYSIQDHSSKSSQLRSLNKWVFQRLCFRNDLIYYHNVRPASSCHSLELYLCAITVNLPFRCDGGEFSPAGPTAQPDAFHIQISSYWRDIV